MLLHVVSVLMVSAAHGALQFGNVVSMGQVTSPELTENSGLGASRLHPDIVYGHNDGGHTNRIFAINVQSGQVEATFTINGATNVDWEDLSVGPCGQGMEGSCIYIADIGGRHTQHTIYKVQEPMDLDDASLDLVAALPFSWHEPDGESMVVSPSGEVYVMSLVQGGNALFAKLPSSGWGSPSPVTIPPADTVRLGLHTAHHDPKGADLSKDGRNLLVKCREDVYYYAFGESPDYIADLRSVSPQLVNTYVRSDDGQSIAWDSEDRGFYVLPEGRIPTVDYYPVSSGSGGGEAPVG